MSIRKRYVPKKIKLLLFLNAFLILSMLVLGTLIVGRLLSPTTTSQEKSQENLISQRMAVESLTILPLVASKRLKKSLPA